jgi:hypothetical protein
MTEELKIGNPEEWRLFVEVHSELTEDLPALVALANKVFNRQFTGNNRDDLLVYNLGMMCFEDFEDILYLAANGRGFGAQKILRAMYEHLVTATYIHKNPWEAKLFIEFEHIRNAKNIRALRAAAPDQVSDETLAEAESASAAVRESFQRRCTCHRRCEQQVDGFSWTELSLPALAHAAGDGLADDLAISYLMPLTETHPSLSAVAGRQTATDDGVTAEHWDTNSRAAGGRALVMAHKYALQDLKLQLDHFPDLAALDGELTTRADVYNRMAANYGERGSKP